MASRTPERLFRIVVFSRIGTTRWREIEKHFCDNEKKLTNLIHKHTLTTDRRNGIGVREIKFVVEEFLNGLWQQMQEHPAKPESDFEKAKRLKLETKRKAHGEKWEKIMSAAEEEHKKRQKKEES